VKDLSLSQISGEKINFAINAPLKSYTVCADSNILPIYGLQQPFHSCRMLSRLHILHIDLGTYTVMLVLPIRISIAGARIDFPILFQNQIQEVKT